MPWFKVDDGFHSHPKTMRAGTAAAGLWVRCGSYAAQHLTDGFVPAEVATQYGTPKMVKALVDAGLWLTEDGGYRMHDYLERNPSRVDVEKDRASAAERQRRAREASKVSRRDSRRDFAGSSVPPTRPDPYPFSSDVGEVVASTSFQEEEVDVTTEAELAAVRATLALVDWVPPSLCDEELAS